jgi:cystathionine beta-lyase/cystathionine gamma-synthase
MIWIETPTNPLLKLVDITAVAEIARQRNFWLVVDNTFASPYFQRPLEQGAHVVVHSTTKYLGGHSDVIGGIAVTSDPAVAERLRFLQNTLGAVPSPFDCFLVLRGLRTLEVRMRRHVENAIAVAAFLAGREDVDRVLDPGITAGLHVHPGAAVAARQMAGPGGMVSFIPAAVGSRTPTERAVAACEGTRLFTLAESLGGVESLIEVPAAMTHASMAGSPLQVDPGLVRLSVGIEDARDLVADLAAALDASGSTG